MRLLRVVRPALLSALFVALGAGPACRRAADAQPADLLIEVFGEHNREANLTRQQTDGKRLFAHYCATCHGDTGRGDGQNAYNLEPAPPDFQESLATHQPPYWRQIIEGGTASVRRSPLCPPWGRSLGPDDIDALAAYLRVLAAPPRPVDVKPPG